MSFPWENILLRLITPLNHTLDLPIVLLFIYDVKNLGFSETKWCHSDKNDRKQQL